MIVLYILLYVIMMALAKSIMDVFVFKNDLSPDDEFFSWAFAILWIVIIPVFGLILVIQGLVKIISKFLLSISNKNTK